LGSRGITVNCVAPGFIETDMTASLSDEQQSAYKKSIPAGRFAQPSEVAAVVAWLASDDAAYITGEALNVSGGQTMA
jgi:3-oxoacyl-[acyl-carrier protein] reductase